MYLKYKLNKLLVFWSSPYRLLITVGILHFSIMWPGILSSDSINQYNMAISGVYSDHHPPLMSLVWRYLDLIYPGSGLMFLLQLTLFYSAVYYFMLSIKNYRYRYLLLILPLLPQIIIYSNMVWKDVAYTFCFLFISSYLTYLTSNKSKLTWLKLLLLFAILIYGTAVKFQAKYCSPIILAWITLALTGYKIALTDKFVKIYGVLLLIFYLLLNSINYILVPNNQKNHSWQFVKIYDLAAISAATNQDLLPEFTKKDNFSKQQLYNKIYYNLGNKQRYYSVDQLIYAENPIIRKGEIPKERKQLYLAWLNAIIHHPLHYLQHRSLNILSTLIYHPAFKHIPTKFYNKPLLLKIIYGFIYLTMSNFLPVIIGFIYLLIGIYILKKHDYQINQSSWYSIPLIFLNAVGLMMLLALFFGSMAGTPRYTYINICMAHASHIFAYLGIRANLTAIPIPLLL